MTWGSGTLNFDQNKNTLTKTLKIAITSVLISLSLALIISCKKGGTGGNTTVVIIVTHYGKAIAGAQVFVKYKSYSFAGTDTTGYDSKQLTGIDGYTHFKNLSVGYYSFYAIGYDSASATKVTGNAEIKIKQKEKGTELELNVPVK